MALDSYSNLKTAIGNLLDRDDLTSFIDDFIDLAEAQHKLAPDRSNPAEGGIRIRDMTTRASLTVNARQVSLPSGFLEARHLRLLTDPVTLLAEVTIHEMSRVREEGTGKPAFFSIYGSEVEFDKTPDSSYSGELIYFAELTALSDSNTSNAILTRAPGAYLYGAALHAAPHLMHDERIAVWRSLYASAVGNLNALDVRATKSGPLIARVAGSRP